jgi:hypothetical protein
VPRASLYKLILSPTAWRKLPVVLAQRWDDKSSVNLYQCADEGRGFFVEVGIDDGREQAVLLRSFVSSEPRADYAHGVRLLEE